jgi:putative flippase GtrA
MTRLRSVVSAKLGTFLRYGAGSLVAMGCSELMLIGSYDIAGAGPLTAAILAWAAGALPNYVLNRRWAWRADHTGQGQGGRGRELALYWTITLSTAAAAVAMTTGMDDVVKGSVTSRGAQSLLLALVYLLAYGVVFIVKFVLFDRWVFANGRSRRQVPSTAPTTTPSSAQPQRVPSTR